MHQALYRRFRPETFEGILGQNHIVKILQNQVRTGTVGHAYLFCGTRGTGKTTTARVLAKGVNCTDELKNRPCGICDNCVAIRDGVFMDVIEIDAASNNGVENIRELRESVKYAPVKGRYKVYIIDEVHMLTKEAFNALLKTLEEPPEYIMFILATTEPSKLPATVLSRCMRLDFHRVSELTIIESMKDICDQVGVTVEEAGLKLIAANGDGSVRDSLSLLDKCIATGERNISRSQVLEALGTRGEEEFIQLTEMVHNGQLGDALLYINSAIAGGIDARQFLKDWTAHYRNLMLLKYLDKGEDILNLSEENISRMKGQSRELTQEEINKGIYTLAEAHSDARWSGQPRIHLELAAARLSGTATEKTAEQKTTFPKTEVIREDGNWAQIWEKIVTEAEGEKKSLYMLKNACIPVCSEEGCLMLEISTPTAERIVKENKDLLQSLLDKHSDKSVRLAYKLSDRGNKPAKEKNAEELAEEISDLLNIDVEIV